MRLFGEVALAASVTSLRLPIEGMRELIGKVAPLIGFQIAIESASVLVACNRPRIAKRRYRHHGVAVLSSSRSWRKASMHRYPGAEDPSERSGAHRVAASMPSSPVFAKDDLVARVFEDVAYRLKVLLVVFND